MKLKYKILFMLIFIFCIFAFIPTKVNAQTIGSLARTADKKIDTFFTMSISKSTNGSTDGASKSGTERRVWYCFYEENKGGNKKGMKTAVLDVGHNSIDEVKNQDKNKSKKADQNITLSVKNSTAARYAMWISYFATQSYKNNEKWGATQTAPYKGAMTYYTGYYAKTLKNAKLFNSELNYVKFDWQTKFYNADKKAALTKEASDYEKGIRNFAFADKSTQSNVKLTTSGSWVFVGPYKVTKTGGTGATLSNKITSIVLTDNNNTTYTPDGWAAKASTSSIKKDIEIPNGTFYLAFKTKKPTTVKKVVIKRKLSGILKSRIVFCAGNGGQDIGVYAGKFTSQTFSIELPGIPYSSLIIEKTDSKTGNALANVQFIVQCSGKGYLVNGTPVTYTSDKKKATIYKTNSKGTVTVGNLKDTGTYTAYEVNNPNDGYIKGDINNIIQSANASITAMGQSKTIKMKNEKYSQITITKKDEETGAALANVQFIVHCSGKGYLIKGTPVTYTSDKTKASKYITNSKGTATVENLKDTGTYTIYEVYNPNKDYIPGSLDNPVKSKSVKITKMGQTVTAAFTNKKLITVTVLKQDKYTKKPLSNVGFIVYCSGRGYLKTGLPATYVSDKNQATVYKTDVNGKFTISNLQYAGTYSLYEVSNPYQGYKEVSLQNPYKITDLPISKSGQNFTVENEKIYTDLKGYVWLDNIDQTKDSGRNDLYKQNSGEQDFLSKNVVVELKHKTDSSKTKQVLTNSNGSYVFQKILINDLPNYEIIFHYNGISYQAVTFNKNASNGSKAQENIAKESRSDFNNKFTTITKGQANGGDKLEYTTSNNTSKLIFGGEGNIDNYGTSNYIDGRGPVSGVYNKYQIKATSGVLTNFASVTDLKKQDGMPSIENINLGLKKREQPDISLVKDLNTAKVDINGVSHIYKYADRFKSDKGSGSADHDMLPQVKFGTGRSDSSYTRALYPSDIQKTGSDTLSVKVTYKIGIKNSSSSLTSVVNQIEDYFDTKYDMNSVVIGTSINNDGTVVEANNLSWTNGGTVGSYNKIIITSSLTIAHGTEQPIYIQLTVKPGEIVKLLDNVGTVKLDNIAEITSYSTKSGNNNYAGIDIDSQPGNLDINKTETYEDDTDKAPGLKLVLQENRTVSGIVFVDSTSEDLMTGKTRNGDGIYNKSEDEGLDGVTVKLIGSKGTTQETTTKNGGEFKFSGLLPDTYKVVYEWGDNEHRVQDYKCTIVNEDAYKAKVPDAKPEWYKDGFKQKYPGIEWNKSTETEIRTSDALDNYDTRGAIDSQTGIITNEIENNINAAYGNEGSTGYITKMESTTPTFRVNIEYYESGTELGLDGNKDKTEYDLDNDGKLQFEEGTNFIKKKEGFKNDIKSIDFGIVERARQVLKLDKQVIDAKLSLATGQMISHVTVNDDGTKDRGSYARYIEKSVGANGQIIFEIPDETIKQSAKLDLEYKLRVTNISEVEYNNPDYYFYGKKQEGNKVTLSADMIVDYFDNNISPDLNNGWEIKKYSDLKDGGLIDTSDKMKEALEGNVVIACSDELKGDLQPAQINESGDIINETDSTRSLQLKGSKLLANTANDEDSLWVNNAEILKIIQKNGGSTLVETMPGNYIYNDSETHEQDDATSESIVITSPTGLQIDYIAFVLLAISSLGILLSGIILIKKYVLKK